MLHLLTELASGHEMNSMTHQTIHRSCEIIKNNRNSRGKAVVKNHKTLHVDLCKNVLNGPGIVACGRIVSVAII